MRQNDNFVETTGVTQVIHLVFASSRALGSVRILLCMGNVAERRCSDVRRVQEKALRLMPFRQWTHFKAIAFCLAWLLAPAQINDVGSQRRSTYSQRMTEINSSVFPELENKMPHDR